MVAAVSRAAGEVGAGLRVTKTVREALGGEAGGKEGLEVGFGEGGYGQI